MLTIPIVAECPYTRASRGLVYIPHAILAELAGAVWDKLEWLCLLKGTRSDNGLVIHVTDLIVPPQYRHSSVCGLSNEEPLDPTIVGALHSHHSYSAFFSKTDKTTMNTRFPLSIVIAQVRQHSTDSREKGLGFAYKAEGRALLPCGELGIVPFALYPDPQPARWVSDQATPSPGRWLHDRGLLAECPNREDHPPKYLKILTTTDCGLTCTAVVPPEYPAQMFGKAGQTLIAEVERTSTILPEPHIAPPFIASWEPSKKAKKRWLRQQQQFDLYDDGYTRPDNRAGVDSGSYIPRRICIICKVMRLDYGQGQAWASFAQSFVDGTGVCIHCASKQAQGEVYECGKAD